MILASMILIPTQVSKLGTLLAGRSVYDNEYQGSHSHVFVCGEADPVELEAFLHEFFNSAGKLTGERVIIMGPVTPRYAGVWLCRRVHCVCELSPLVGG